VCKPKKQGGLGFLNLELQNKALLLKQLHKFYDKAVVPWVKLVWSLYGDSVPHAQTNRGSFLWRDILSLSEKYRVSQNVKLVMGLPCYSRRIFGLMGLFYVTSFLGYIRLLLMTIYHWQLFSQLLSFILTLCFHFQ
jgi:hypothetical protein